MIPIVASVVAALSGAVWWKTRNKEKKQEQSKQLTPQQERVYTTALATLKDPVKLNELASAFDKAGKKEHADLLKKRAVLRELPEEQKKARREAFKKGMSSRDPIAVETLADSFEKEGATGAAETLRKYAATLRAGSENTLPLNKISK